MRLQVDFKALPKETTVNECCEKDLSLTLLQLYCTLSNKNTPCLASGCLYKQIFLQESKIYIRLIIAQKEIARKTKF